MGESVWVGMNARVSAHRKGLHLYVSIYVRESA
jgi:hypothetical protein